MGISSRKFPTFIWHQVQIDVYLPISSRFLPSRWRLLEGQEQMKYFNYLCLIIIISLICFCRKRYNIALNGLNYLKSCFQAETMKDFLFNMRGWMLQVDKIGFWLSNTQMKVRDQYIFPVNLSNFKLSFCCKFHWCCGWNKIVNQMMKWTVLSMKSFKCPSSQLRFGSNTFIISYFHCFIVISRCWLMKKMAVLMEVFWKRFVTWSKSLLRQEQRIRRGS